MSAMMCDECGIRPAVISLTTIANGEKQERKLCISCMAKLKKQLPNLDLSGLVGLMSGFLEAANAGQEAEIEPDITCEACGTTYSEFRNTGLLGCAQCYKAFHEPLEALLKRIHGQTHHAGRVPGGRAGQISLKFDIDRLKQQLVRAIAAEEYEQAAALRDQIRALSAQLQAGDVQNHPQMEVPKND